MVSFRRVGIIVIVFLRVLLLRDQWMMLLLSGNVRHFSLDIEDASHVIEQQEHNQQEPAHALNHDRF